MNLSLIFFSWNTFKYHFFYQLEAKMAPCIFSDHVTYFLKGSKIRFTKTEIKTILTF